MFFDEYEDFINSIRSIEDGCIAYHNCCVVAAYYEKYGYTEHLKELIGEEGLVKDAVSAVGKFLTWLKEKIKEICKKLWKFILKIVNWILGLFGFKPIGSSDNTSITSVTKSMNKVVDKIKGVSVRDPEERIQFKYNLDRIYDYLGDQVSLINTIYRNKVDVANNTYLDNYNRIVQEVVDATCDALTDTSDDRWCDAGTLKNILTGLSATAQHCISVAATVQKELDDFQSKITERSTVKDIVKEMIAMKGSLQWNMITIGYNQDDNPKELVAGFIRYLMINTKALLTVARKIAPVIDHGAKAFNKDRIIEHEETFNQDLLRRLSNFFGASFKVTKVIFSTKDPHTWIVSDDDGTVNGWCCSGKDLHGSTILFINYRSVLAQLKRNDDITKVSRLVMKHVVHECRHLFDAQTGADFDDFSIEYEDRQHEQRAFRDQEIFLITDKDINWIAGIIRKIESTYGNK